MKFVRVNMNDQTINEEAVPQEYIGLGGRGLTSIMINNEVPPACDPLGPENKLIIAPGILSGTPLMNTSRISIGAKSPLTGGIKESNAGGTIAAALGRLGITAIIIEGQAPEGELSLLRIDDKGNASLISAHEYPTAAMAINPGARSNRPTGFLSENARVRTRGKRMPQLMFGGLK